MGFFHTYQEGARDLHGLNIGRAGRGLKISLRWAWRGREYRLALRVRTLWPWVLVRWMSWTLEDQREFLMFQGGSSPLWRKDR